MAVSPLLVHCIIAPSLAGLYQLHPALHIEVQADDRMVDMVRDGIDIAFRTGSAGQDSLVARKVGEHGRSLYAAPAYLTQRGTPQHPNDLAQHHLIGRSVAPWMNQWIRTEDADLAVRDDTRTDNSALIMSLVVHGVGIGRLNDLMVRPLVQAAWCRYCRTTSPAHAFPSTR